jgi:hypothetical protein
VSELTEALDDVTFGVTSHLINTSELPAGALDNLAVVADAARRWAAIDSEETREAIAQALHDDRLQVAHPITECHLGGPDIWIRKADIILAVLRDS